MSTADTDNDIEKLVEKTEKEGDQEEPEKKEGLSFAFAKIWAADKDTLEEMADDSTQSNDKDDSWAQTLAVSVW
jgi:chromodomain-helicase-DNA-binding protein 4